MKVVSPHKNGPNGVKMIVLTRENGPDGLIDPTSLGKIENGPSAKNGLT